MIICDKKNCIYLGWNYAFGYTCTKKDIEIKNKICSNEYVIKTEQKRSHW